MITDNFLGFCFLKDAQKKEVRRKCLITDVNHGQCYEFKTVSNVFEHNIVQFRAVGTFVTRTDHSRDTYVCMSFENITEIWPLSC